MKRRNRNYVVLPATILDKKQTGDYSANIVVIIAYLISLHQANQARRNLSGFQVTQERIGRSCGLCAKTVGTIIKKLEQQGLITVYQDEWNGKKRETNVYKMLKPLLDMSNGFFYVPRKIFKRGLSPKQILMYLFLCHSQCYELGSSWNSYNDISMRLSLSRSEVIRLIKNLESMGYITKRFKFIKHKSKKKSFADNRYSVVWLVFFLEKRSSSIRSCSHQKTSKNKINITRTHYKSQFKNNQVNSESLVIIFGGKLASDVRASVFEMKVEERLYDQLQLPFYTRDSTASLNEGYPF